MKNQDDNFSSSESSSVTEWVHDLKAGDAQAAQQILARYIGELIRVASRKLGHSRRRVADEEDVVSIAFANFLKRVEHGGFSKLEDRNDLWQILFTLTERKAIDLIRHENAASRGADQLVGESVFETLDDSRRSTGINSVPGHQDSPEYAAILTEEFESRMSILDEQQQQIAMDKMHGLSNQEIADYRELKLRTVERRLQDIRNIWQAS